MRPAFFCEEDMREEIEKLIEDYVRPSMNAHEGDIELLEIKDGVAYVRFTGKCSGCPAARVTLEEIVKEELLGRTDKLTDVILEEETDQELYDLAKGILSGQIRLGE